MRWFQDPKVARLEERLERLERLERQKDCVHWRIEVTSYDSHCVYCDKRLKYEEVLKIIEEIQKYKTNPQGQQIQPQTGYAGAGQYSGNLGLGGLLWLNG